jgi:MFS family permease
VGLAAGQIGLLAGLLPLVTLVSAPLWGALADATWRRHALLLLAIGGTIAAMLALSRTASLQALIPIVVANAFFLAPLIPLVDNTGLAMLGEQRSLYARQRLWGAVGWGITAPAAGWLLDRTGIAAPFDGYVVLMFGCLLVAIGLPVGLSFMGAAWSERQTSGN